MIHPRDTVTITRDAWNDMNAYIALLERRVEEQEDLIIEANNYIGELEERLDG